MSCNGNMGYLAYWPMVASAWRKLGITPVLFFILDSDIAEPPPADGIVHCLEPLPDVAISPSIHLCQILGSTVLPG